MTFIFNLFICFQYLPDKDFILNSTVSNSNFNLMDENMNLLGFSKNHKQAIYMILSAILNLGNIEFGVQSDDNSSYIEKDKRIFLNNAAMLLKVDVLELESVLISHTRETGKLQIK